MTHRAWGEIIPPATQSEIDESVQQFTRAWSLLARKSAAGEVFDRGSLVITDAGVGWPAMNAAFFPRRLSDTRAFAADLQHAAEHFNTRGREFMVAIAPDWIEAEARPEIERLLGDSRFVPALQLTGMVAENLSPPRHRLPQLEIRRVEDNATRYAIAELNAVAYEIPREWALEALAIPGLWTEEVSGYVGYANGRAITCAAVLLIDGVSYVALVATLPEHRGQGYAEAVMRYALQQSASRATRQRSVLHSTPPAVNLYKQMGYRAVTEFTLYLRAEPAAG